MPLHTGSHSLRTRNTKKDGRKRTSSTVSNSATKPQDGPVEGAKSVETGQSPKETPNGSRSKQALNPQAASESSPDKHDEPAKKIPNVFEFLDEDDGPSSNSSDSSETSDFSEYEDEPSQAAPEIQSPKPRTSPASHALLAPKPGPPQKPIESSSTVPSRSSRDSRPPQAPSAPASTETQLQLARKQSQVQKYNTSSREGSPSFGKRQLQLSRPENHYTPRDPSALHRPPLPPSPPSSPEDSIHRGTPAKRRVSNASQVSSGYGLVASHLTRSAGQEKAGFPPLYRRFESLNHRVLLHLQDEISQMEEDLHTLDEYEEMHRVATAEQEGTKPTPASRRLEARSQAYSELHYRRMDLMAALIQKTEQYSTPLPSTILSSTKRKI